MAFVNPNVSIKLGKIVEIKFVLQKKNGLMTDKNYDLIISTVKLAGVKMPTMASVK